MSPENGTARVHSNNFKKLQAQLRGSVGKAIGDYDMIADGDRVMVCLSGGKDSYTLLDILLSLQRSAPIRFEIDRGQSRSKAAGLSRPRCCRGILTELGVPFRIIEQNTYSVVKRVIPDGKTMCGLCSRLRRGALYRFAAENGITKIALGHHRDDIVETLFLNMFFGGRLKAMPPKLLSEDRRHIVIRPLALRGGAQHRALRRGARVSHHSLHAVRLADPHAAPGGEEHAARSGKRNFRGASSRYSPASAMSPPRSSRIRRLFDFAGSTAAPTVGVPEGASFRMRRTVPSRCARAIEGKILPMTVPASMCKLQRTIGRKSATPARARRRAAATCLGDA